MRSKCRKYTSTNPASRENKMQSNIYIRWRWRSLPRSWRRPCAHQGALKKQQWSENLNSQYISSQSSKWREAQIEKSYLLFQAVSITNTKMPCPFPQSPVQWEVEQGTWTAIKEPLEQWTELLRTDEQRNESTQVL